MPWPEPGRITPRKLKHLKAQPTQKTDVIHGRSTRVSAQGSEAGSYQGEKKKGFQTPDLSLWLSVTASPTCRVGVRAPRNPPPAVHSLRTAPPRARCRGDQVLQPGIKRRK